MFRILAMNCPTRIVLAIVASLVVGSCGGQSTSSTDRAPSDADAADGQSEAGSASSPDLDASGGASGAVGEGGEANADANKRERCDPQIVGQQLVCFGAAVSDYAKYLKPGADVGVGECPSVGAFQSSQGEGSCGYSVCGPLQPTEIPADAGVDGSSSCCFWAVQICGV